MASTLVSVSTTSTAGISPHLFTLVLALVFGSLVFALCAGFLFIVWRHRRSSSPSSQPLHSADVAVEEGVYFKIEADGRESAASVNHRRKRSSFWCAADAVPAFLRAAAPAPAPSPPSFAVNVIPPTPASASFPSLKSVSLEVHGWAHTRAQDQLLVVPELIQPDVGPDSASLCALDWQAAHLACSDSDSVFSPSASLSGPLSSCSSSSQDSASSAPDLQSHTLELALGEGEEDMDLDSDPECDLAHSSSCASWLCEEPQTPPPMVASFPLVASPASSPAPKPGPAFDPFPEDAIPLGGHDTLAELGFQPATPTPKRRPSSAPVAGARPRFSLPGLLPPRLSLHGAPFARGRSAFCAPLGLGLGSLPSLPTSADGNWTEEEGDAAFDDATEHDDVFVTASSTSASVSCTSPASSAEVSEGGGGTERLSALLDALSTSFSVASLKLELGFSMVGEQCSKVGECTAEERPVEETVLETGRAEKGGSGDFVRDVVLMHEGPRRRDTAVFAT